MKKLLIIIFLQFLFFSLVLAQTVYVTKSGKKYHVSSCGYLSRSSIPIELKDAIEIGYSPCSICDPPTQSNKSKTSSNNLIQKYSSNKKSTENKQQCIAITKKGTQCTRTAQDGSVYCWQHNRKGTKSYNSNSYGRTIFTGPRGGKYYYNSKGNKVYIKK